LLPRESSFAISTLTRWLVLLIAPLLIAIMGWAAWDLVREHQAGAAQEGPWAFVVRVGILAAIALVSVVATIWVLRARLTMNGDGMRVRGLFGSRVIPWEKFEGYRLTGGRLFAYPLEDRWPLNLEYFGNQGLLRAWLHLRIPSLDERDLQREDREIRADRELGWTDREKAATLAALRRPVKALNWVAYAGAAIGGANAIFLDDPTVQLVAACALMAVPLLLIALALRFRDQVRLDYREGSLYPEGLTGVVASGVILGLMSLLDRHNTLGDRHAQLTTALAAGYALLWLNIEWKRMRLERRWMLFGLYLASVFFVSGFWAGGAVYQFNKIADVSQPVWGSTTVTAMRESREKTGTSYHVKLAPWSASPHETVELTVSRETYEMLRPGAAVDVGVRRGALQIPWVDSVSPRK